MDQKLKEAILFIVQIFTALAAVSALFFTNVQRIAALELKLDYLESKLNEKNEELVTKQAEDYKKLNEDIRVIFETIVAKFDICPKK